MVRGPAVRSPVTRKRTTTREGGRPCRLKAAGPIGARGDGSHGGVVGVGDDRGAEFTETVRVFMGVVTAEQQFATGRKDGSDTSGGTAPIAPVGGGQLRAGQRTGHDSSKLATTDNGRLGSGPPRRGGAVDLLLQTNVVPVLFPLPLIRVPTHDHRTGIRLTCGFRTPSNPTRFDVFAHSAARRQVR